MAIECSQSFRHVVFFFSSRRRHTRCSRDWSSDVCSSDLLSDRVGRRPVLLTTMVLNTGGYLLFAFAGSYWALFASRVIGGFAGGNISPAQAHVAHPPPPAGRARGVGVLWAAVGLGVVIGAAVRGGPGGGGAPAPP